MELTYARCAGLDVHKDTVVACVRIEVDDRVRASERRVEGGGVEDGVFDEGDVRAGEVGAVAGAQVVEGDHAVDLGPAEQFAAQVGPDEPGPAGDNDLHRDTVAGAVGRAGGVQVGWGSVR